MQKVTYVQTNDLTVSAFIVGYAVTRNLAKKDLISVTLVDASVYGNLSSALMFVERKS